MNWRFSAYVLAILPAFNAMGASSVITGKIQDVLAGTSARAIVFESMTDPSVESGGGGTVTLNSQKTVTCGTDGTFSVTLHSGGYRVTVSDPWQRSVWKIQVPTNGLPYTISDVWISGTPTNAANYYSSSAIDGLLSGYLRRPGKVWIVDAVYGNDSLATNSAYASLTLANAKTLASAGDLVQVRPGNYTNNNWIKAGVNWEFADGANVYWTVPTNTDAGYGFIDDRATGATTNVISGLGTFYFRDSNPECANLLGAISLTNARSELRFSAKALFYGSRSATYLSGISVRNCRVSHFRLQTLADTYEAWADDVPPPDTTYLTSQATGVYWENGEMHCSIDNNTSYAGYAVWSRDIGNATNSLYYDGNLIASSNFNSVYVSGAATSQGTLRTWVNVKEIYSPQIGLSMLGSVKAYVTAQKISGGTGGIAIDASGELWAWVQKVSAGGTWVRKVASIEPKPTPAKIFALQYEALSDSMTDGILNTSTNDLFIYGGYAKGGTNQTRMVRHAGTGATKLIGLTVDGTLSANTNSPVLVSSNGLSFEGGKVLASSVAPLSMHATTSRIVDIQGLYANKALNSLITQSNGWLQVSNTLTAVNDISAGGAFSNAGASAFGGPVTTWAGQTNMPASTSKVATYVSLAGGHTTDSVQFARGPALVGGIDGYGLGWSSISNSAVRMPAGYEIWSQDTDGSDTNVINTLTSIFGTGTTGSRTLPAFFWTHGRNVVVDMEGSYWSAGSGGLTAVNGLFNGVTLNASAVTLLSSQSGDNWVGHWVINCRTNVGATNLISGGRMTFGSSTTMRFTNTVTLLTDPTAAGLIDIQTTNATVGHSILMRTARILLYP